MFFILNQSSLIGKDNSVISPILYLTPTIPHVEVQGYFGLFTTFSLTNKTPPSPRVSSKSASHQSLTQFSNS